MIKRGSKYVTVWTLVLAVLFNVFFPFGAVYAAEGTPKPEAGEQTRDVTDNLKITELKVTQDGKKIENNTINGRAPVSVEASFRVPVLGDMANDETLTEEQCVYKGDTATFKLSDAFQLVSKSGEEIELKTKKDVLVGHVSFSTDSETKMVTAKVVFDGEEEAFGNGSSEVFCKFNAELRYDASGAPDDGEEKQVRILDKKFTLKVPPVEKTYTVKKEGKVNQDDKTVEWTVKLSGKQGKKVLDLEDYQFSDDLSDVGTYVKDSFKVNGKDAAPDLSDDILSYSFPEKTSGEQKITFKTEISDEVYYGTGTQIANTAWLLDEDGKSVGEDEGKANLPPKQWITKEGKANGDKKEGSSGEYNPKNRTITWTITANQMKASLTGVVITDKLPEGLTFESAKWKQLNNGEWGKETSIEPNDKGEYLFGEINSEIMLIIVTKVPDETYVTGKNIYSNSASIRWDSGPAGPGGAKTGNIDVPIGYNAITKSGKADYEKDGGEKEGKITWTVDVDLKKQDVPTPKVYDLLVYGESIDLSKVTGIPEKIKKSLTPQYNQKYIGETFHSENSDITLEQVYTVKAQDDTAVADLLEVTGFQVNTPASFTFDTQILDPNIYAGNETSAVINTASLFSENAKLNAATDTVNYASHMLAKEMLKRGAAPNTAESVNSNKTANAGEGFDYKDKSVIFRLSVNADSMDFTKIPTDADDTPLGKATLTDTLPEGWEFTEIASGKKYLIFDGKTGDNSSVTATGSPLDPVSNFKAEFEGGTASFTFSELKTPYVILVKARPTYATAAEYFSSNQTVTKTNQLSLKTEHWTPGVSTSRDVSITSTIFDKTVPENAKDGVLEWTVDYQPYGFDLKGKKLEDQLPIGIDLRTDSKGALLLNDSFGTPNLAVYETTLNADGSYTLGNSVSLTVGENVSYNNASRVLSFTIPDSEKAYRFIYVTDVTGDPHNSVSNHVSLFGSTSAEVSAVKTYSISDMDGSASMKRNGWIEVTKTGEEGKLLSGAEFTVLTSDGSTVIRKGTTGADGTVTIRGIPDGTYLLRETKAPDDYTLDKKTHTLTVVNTAASIDGKTGNGANEVTVQDFKTGTVGDLTIRKTVTGNAGDKTKAFAFTVTFSGLQNEENKAYSYIGYGVPDGTIQSGGTVSLADGQSITVTGLPKELSYTVTEADYSAEGYAKQSMGETGVIAADATQTAAFTNTKTSSHSGGGGGGGGGGGHEEPSQPGTGTGTGSLTVRKTVVGQGADLTRKFAFTFVFSGADGAYPYTGSTIGTLHSGDTVFLANGESITVQGLPAGTEYTVTESDPSADGYAVSADGASGVISAGTTRTAAFTNTWNGPSKTGGTGNTGAQGPAGGAGTAPREVAAGGKNGMPATGDHRTELAKLGLLVSSVSFAAFFLAGFRYRGKHFLKE